MSVSVSTTVRRAIAHVVAIVAIAVPLAAAMQAGSAHAGAAGTAHHAVARHSARAQDTNWG